MEKVSILYGHDFCDYFVMTTQGARFLEGDFDSEQDAKDWAEGEGYQVDDGEGD